AKNSCSNRALHYCHAQATEQTASSSQVIASSLLRHHGTSIKLRECFLLIQVVLLKVDSHLKGIVWSFPLKNTKTGNSMNKACQQISLK
ncbi:hypothetical protein KI387_007032, partial [Taxus chinensis]